LLIPVFVKIHSNSSRAAPSYSQSPFPAKISPQNRIWILTVPRAYATTRAQKNPATKRAAFCQTTSDNRLIEPEEMYVYKYLIRA
jgi:hypothetical protein